MTGNFSSCTNCGASVLRGADECPQCGYAMFAKDRRAQGTSDNNERERRRRERLYCADYERKRFQLEPQGEGESLDAFVARIDREKTPAILAEHRALLQRLDANHTNDLPLPREPGSDDEVGVAA